MKFLDIVWKEISLVKSQRIALLLILIYPLLVVMLIGAAVPNLDVTKMKETKIGIVNELSFAPDFDEKFSSLNELTIVSFVDENALINAIKRKEVTTGLRLSGTSKYEQIRVELFYDNSSLLSSKYFVEIAKAMMQRISSDLSREELGRIWELIAQLGKNVGKEEQNINEFKSQLAAAGVSLDKLENDLSAIDFNEIDSSLADQSNTVNEFSQKNQEFKNEIISFKNSFEDMKEKISDLNAQLSPFKGDLSNLSTQLSEIDSALGANIAGLTTLRDSMSDGAQKDALTAQIDALALTRSKLAPLGATAARLVTFANELENSNSSLNTTLNRADSLFARVEAESNDITGTLGSSSQTISSMNQKLLVFKNSLNEVKALIVSSRASKNEIEGQLNESSALLSSFGSQLTGVSEVDPAVIAKPAIFYERKVFNVEPFGILVSNSSVVVLILTCMLLSAILIILEKTQHVTQRLQLSPTSRTVLLAGKIVGQLVIAWVEAAIIFAVAVIRIPVPFKINGKDYIGFGLQIASSWVDVFIAVTVIAIAFIAIGVLISYFTKNQSTAILASLLAAVPMLFLSGIILPIDFMEPFMQALSSVLPLTIANNILVGLIVKGQTLWELMLWIAALLLFSLIIFVAVLVKKE